ncbi:hypothetical protein [Serratia fonticola]
MNLHGIVSGVIGAVNPFVPGQMKVSNGYIKDSAFKQVPAFLEPFDVSIQLQALTYSDLQHIDGLNIQGIVKSAYVQGNFNGVNRPRQQGGDYLLLSGETWKIVKIVEEWPDWCKFVINLQVPT